MRRRRRSFEQNCKENFIFFLGSREIVVHDNITFASILLLKCSATALQNHLCPPSSTNPTRNSQHWETERERERDWQLGRKDGRTKGRKDDRCTPYRFTLGVSIQRRWKRVHITIASLQTPSTPSPPHLFQLPAEKRTKEPCFQTPTITWTTSQSLRACIFPPLIGHLCFGKGLGERREGKGRVKGPTSTQGTLYSDYVSFKK